MKNKIITLSDKQKEVIKTLYKCNHPYIMYDGWVTGGYGVCFDLRSVNSLKKKGILDHNGQLTELGKAIQL